MQICFKRRSYVLFWVGIGLLLAATRESQAGNYGLGAATDYNVFVFKDDTQSGSDVEGRVAVGRDALFGGSGFNIASKLSAKETLASLVVGRDYSNKGNQVQGPVVIGRNATIDNPTINGNLSVNGNLTLTGYGTVNGQTLNYGGAFSNPHVTLASGIQVHAGVTTPLPIDFTAAQSDLIARSAYLGGLSANGLTALAWGGITLNSLNSDPLQVFNLSGSALSTAWGLTINAKAGQTVVVNIDGTIDSMKNMGLTLNGIDAGHVLYNFKQATSLSLGGISVLGSILAPYADVSFSSGQFNGTLVANSITGSGEFHNVRFNGDLPGPPPTSTPAPEPGTFVIFAIAGVISWLGMRNRRTA